MVGAVSAVRPWGVSRVLGAHATMRRGPTPVRALEEPTAALPVLRVLTYQLRPDGRIEMRVHRSGSTVDLRG